MTLIDNAPEVSLEELGTVHMAGIGGIGMSGIAHLLLARGVPVSGCDAQESGPLPGLRDAGATVSVGHDPVHTRDIDTLVTSSAVAADNSEVAEARRQGVRILPRAGALASVMSGHYGVAVTGAHGKTTTTSLLASALLHCGAAPTYLVGGIPAAPATGGSSPAGASTGVRDGTGEIFVAEADESDGSFLLLSPNAAIVTNVEADHLDNYGDAQAVHDAFARFVGRIAPQGFLVCCADDPGARTLAARARQRGIEVRTYGESQDADVRVAGLQMSGLETSFHLVEEGSAHGEVRLHIPGRHNALNATAAIVAGLRLGFDFAALREGVAAFGGVQRRFEVKGEARGVRVIDSYAHHPTEIAADMRTARDMAGQGKVIAAFQPHLYSRTRHFATELGQALGLADHVVVMEVYAAREVPDFEVSGDLVARAVPLPEGHVRFEPAFDAVPALLADVAAAGDVVLTLGAGSVTALGPSVLRTLAASGAERVDARLCRG